MNVMRQACESSTFIQSKLRDMKPGESYFGKLVFQYREEKAHEIPVYLIKGAHEGKTIWIQGGLHGDEYDGIVTSIRLLKNIKADLLHGTVIIVPKLNVSAFEAGQNGSSIDGINLNRVFKEQKQESFSYGYGEFIHYIISKTAHYVIDLHGGGKYLEVAPFAIIPDTCSKADEISKKMAEACSISYLFDNNNKDSGMLIQQLSRDNIPAILLENGGGVACSEEAVGGHLHNVYRILETLGFLQGEVIINDSDKKIIRQVSELYFEHSGVLLSHAQVGDIVKKNDLLLEVMDLENNDINSLFSPVSNGVVLSIHTAAKVDKGKYAVMIGLLK